MLRSRLGLLSADINNIGNLRFMGATDNIRKRAELPSSYFTRLKASGIDIYKHILLDDISNDPKKLILDLKHYTDFRERRLDRMWEILNSTVNPEIGET